MFQHRYDFTMKVRLIFQSVVFRLVEISSVFPAKRDSILLKYFSSVSINKHSIINAEKSSQNPPNTIKVQLLLRISDVVIREKIYPR